MEVFRGAISGMHAIETRPHRLDLQLKLTSVVATFYRKFPVVIQDFPVVFRDFPVED